MTGKWHDPVFSLRRQADLVKLARRHGVEELLPHTVKGTEERIRKRVENGLRVKGTGIGQRVKGKESERTLKGRYVTMHCSWRSLLLGVWNRSRASLLTMMFCRLEKRRQAMLDMPQMIQTWKEVSYCCSNYLCNVLTLFLERTWSWVEEVAEIGWHAVEGRSWLQPIRRSLLVEILYVFGLAWVTALDVLITYQLCISMDVHGLQQRQINRIHISSVSNSAWLSIALLLLLDGYLRSEDYTTIQGNITQIVSHGYLAASDLGTNDPPITSVSKRSRKQIKS